MTDPIPPESETASVLNDAPEQDKGWSPNPSRRRIAVAALIIVLSVFGALYAWGLPPFDGGDQTTNNAYVRGCTTVVSPQVGGYLVDVPVVDFQRVKKGDLLARIDDVPFREKVQQGEANTAAQMATLANNEQSLRSAQAQLALQDAAVASARAGLQKAQADMDRIAELVDEGSVSLRNATRPAPPCNRRRPVCGRHRSSEPSRWEASVRSRSGAARSKRSSRGARLRRVSPNSSCPAPRSAPRERVG